MQGLENDGQKKELSRATDNILCSALKGDDVWADRDMQRWKHSAGTLEGRCSQAGSM